MSISLRYSHIFHHCHDVKPIEPILILNWNYNVQWGVYAMKIRPPAAKSWKLKSHIKLQSGRGDIYPGQRFDPSTIMHSSAGQNMATYSQRATPTQRHRNGRPLLTSDGFPRAAIKSCQQFDCKIKFGNRLNAPGQAANLSAVGPPPQPNPTQNSHWKKSLPKLVLQDLYLGILGTQKVTTSSKFKFKIIRCFS